MRPRLRPLRELVQDLHLSPEERHIALAEECLETLFDPGRCACADLGEREEAALEAERRRWCGPDPEPDYNVSPRRNVLAVREREGQRVLSRLRWGLVPSWAKEVKIGDRMINARAETVASKPAYRRAFANKRCLIPADGFYEWKAGTAAGGDKKPRKQPYFIHRKDGEPLAFAGLWEVWKVPDDRPDNEKDLGGDDGWLRSCVIVTTTANELMAPIHNRMPVILPESGAMMLISIRIVLVLPAPFGPSSPYTAPRGTVRESS